MASLKVCLLRATIDVDPSALAEGLTAEGLWYLLDNAPRLSGFTPGVWVQEEGRAAAVLSRILNQILGELEGPNYRTRITEATPTHVRVTVNGIGGMRRAQQVRDWLT